jgi:hypothetical protein
MQRLLLALGALALTLTTTASNVNAAEHRGHEERHEVVRHELNHGRYYEQHGVHFKGGYYYPGFDHHHWAHKIWDARLNRWEYWDADLNVYYYWAPTQNCYYPVTYVCP